MTNQYTLEKLNGAVDRAIETYGETSQLLTAIEELAELTQALTKHTRTPTDKRREQIIEELADVIFVTQTVKRIYGISEGIVGESVRNKIDRLNDRIDRGLTSTGDNYVKK
jgi:NTP pyrophosphatase (non-canonical NTP hydrolase)